MNKLTMNMRILKRLCLIGAIVVGNIFLIAITIQDYSVQNNLLANKLIFLTLLIAVISIASVISLIKSIFRTIDIYKNPEKYPHLTQKAIDYQIDEEWAPPSNEVAADLFFTDDGDATNEQLFRLDSKEREEYLRKRKSAVNSVKKSKKKLYEDNNSVDYEDDRDKNDYLTPKKRDIDIEMYTNKKDFYRKNNSIKKPINDTLPD